MESFTHEDADTLSIMKTFSYEFFSQAGEYASLSHNGITKLYEQQKRNQMGELGRCSVGKVIAHEHENLILEPYKQAVPWSSLTI